MADKRSTDRTNQERMGSSGWRRRSIVVNLMDVEEGTKVSLGNEGVAEVVSNPRDGSWILVKHLEVPDDASKVGEEELIFAEDVFGTVE